MGAVFGAHVVGCFRITSPGEAIDLGKQPRLLYEVVAVVDQGFCDLGVVPDPENTFMQFSIEKRGTRVISAS
ncbi:hypothetical protein D3C75_601760 [compost metagenome]